MTRRTTYNKDKVNRVLLQVSSGDSLSLACKKHKIALSSFNDWVRADREGLNNLYEVAKESHMHALCGKLQKLCEDPLTKKESEDPRSYVKLRELNLKRIQWELEKRYRRFYGNHLTVEHDHTHKLDLHKLREDLEKRRKHVLGSMKTVEVVNEKPLEFTQLNETAQV